MKTVWLVLVMMWVGVSAAQAEPYKWVDKDGKVHYSDQKPDEKMVHPESTVEKPDLDKGNFVSAEEAGLIVTEEEKQRRAEAAAKKKEEEERLRKEEREARKAAEEAAAKVAAEAEKEKKNNDDGYDYYDADIDGDNLRPEHLPAERPRPPANRPRPRSQPR